VSQAADRILVRATDQGGHLQEIEGDALVVTLPATTLRDIEITPALPEDQQRAIARLRYGCATKVVVQHVSPGLQRRRAQAFATDGALGAFWDATEGQPSASSSIISFLGGGAASPKLAARGESGAGALLSELCWLGLAGSPVLGNCRATWEDDPFALGGYAYADPGFDPAWKPLLSRRAGRIVFGGEHTSEDFQGYMEGAVESGQRAADELIRGGR